MTRIIASLFLALIVCFFVSVANAAEEQKEPDEKTLIAKNDLIFQALQGLTGQTANIIVGGETPNKPDHLIAELSKTLNYGLMSLAILFMISSGIKWLSQLNGDKKQESLLDFQSAPLKVIIAVILLLPMPNGYSAIQHVVIKVAGEGISLANKLTNKAADFLEKTGTYSVNPSVMNSEKIIFDMMESAVCMALVNQANQKTVVQATAIFQSDLDDDLYSYTVNYGGIFSQQEAIAMLQQDFESNFSNGRTQYLSPNACGSTRLEFGALDENYVSSATVIEFREGMVNAYKQLNGGVLLLGAQFVDHLLIPKVIGKNGPEYNETYPADLEEQLKTYSEAFRLSYQRELEKLVAKMEPSEQSSDSALANKRATESLRQYGAGYLGVFFWEFAKRNNVVSNITKVNKAANPPIFNEIQKKVSEAAFTKIFDKKNELFSNIRFDSHSESLDRTGRSNIEILSNIEKDISSKITKADHEWDIGGSFLFNIATKQMMQETDPILAYMEYGHTLMGVGEITIAASAIESRLAKLAVKGLEGVAMAASSTPFTGAGAIPAMVGTVAFDIIIDVANHMTMVGMGLLMLGAFMALYMGALPVFHWISGLTGFLIVFMQAMILTPLLAIAHLLNGESSFMSSKTQHGYMAILQLFIHLPLMVIGFFVAYLIAMFGAKFIQILFVPSMQIMLGDNMVGVITGFFLTALFVMLNTQIINRSFALITTLPEKAGKFIGGGEEMLGDSQGEQSLKAGFVSVSSQVNSISTSALKTSEQSRGGANTNKSKINSRTS